jgi:hypothetical protein
LDHWSCRHENLAAPFKGNSFSNISIISGITQIDWRKVTCVYSTCHDYLYQRLSFTLDYHTILNEKSYFKFVNDSAVQQINLKKKPALCVLVCLPVVAKSGPFRDLPHELPCDQDLQACWAEGKLHPQAHTAIK